MSFERIESISESLVREYLKRKGLLDTLQKMDHECPRKPGSVSNRAELIKTLNIKHLITKNKKNDVPFRAMLEVIANDLIHSDSSQSPDDHDPSKCPTDRSMCNSGNNSGSHETTPDDEHKHDKGSPKSGVDRYKDLVLEDSVDDGETIVGDGKAGVLSKTPHDDPPIYTGLVLPSGDKQKQSRLRGMSGPISSNLNERDRNRMSRARSGRSEGRTIDGRSEGRAIDDAPLSWDNSPPKPLKHTTEMRKTSNSSPPERKKSSHHHRNHNLPDDHLGDAPDTNNASINTHNHPVDTQNPSVPSNNRKKTLDDILSADANTRLESASTSRAHKRLQDKEKEKDLDNFNYPVSQSSISKDKNNHKTRTMDEARELLNMLSGKKPSEKPKNDDLELGDVDDLEDEVNDLDIGGRVPVQKPSFVVDSKPIDIKTASELKTLILGSPQQNFNDEWRHQSFTFCDLPRLHYGIVQKKGGPCGVLASVQACVLQDLFFRHGHHSSNKDLEPSRDRRSEALAAALSNILWRAGDGTSAIVTLPGLRPHLPNSSRFKTDNLTETLTVNTLTSRDDVFTFVRQNIRQFELDGSSGVILLLYSALLSRTIARVRQDMDEPDSKMMGAHGYCTQEMVNLILTGRAASNVFNDVIELDGGTVLRGVHERSQIGLMSLFEHYKSCQVGAYLKTPKHAIWVVCSESHFSVLFSLKKDLMCDWKAEKRFDLFYYDGLGRQDAEIRLSIDTTNRFFQAPSEDDLVPPLELCIRTKWPDAEVDWNGTDPLL